MKTYFYALKKPLSGIFTLKIIIFILFYKFVYDKV